MPNIGDVVTCTETGKQFVVAQDGCSLNYATNPQGEIVSDEGVDIREKRELSHRHEPFTCYVNSSGSHVTGWKGNVLGQITHSSTSRNGWHGSALMHVRVRDVHGGMWYGKGAGCSMIITLRPTKD